ncbi:hypothetical protein XENOCAPTIV_025887 [Xenoophorus captivus]|uniref:Uncharacterized protein n=1 Tax=Xenoophorus captivus TaxID=1517983 RepID=A0ABV0QMZ7_9TELE
MPQARHANVIFRVELLLFPCNHFIMLLKQQLGSLQEELKRRESRWASTHSRLRQHINSLNQESSSLRDEVHRWSLSHAYT